jgi:sugar transferase (PEP-CTERM system associated)
MRVFHRHLSRRHLIVFSGELVVIFAWTMLVARYLSSSNNILASSTMSAVVTVLYLACAYYRDLYDLTAVHTTQEIVVRVIQAVAIGSAFLGVLHVTLLWRSPADDAFLAAGAVFLTGILSWRLAFKSIATLHSVGERLLFIGTDPAAQTVARQVLAQEDFPYTIFGFIDEDPSRIGQSIVNPRVVGTPADIEQIVTTHGIDRIVVGLGDRRGRLPVHELLHAKMRGVSVEDVNTLYERLTGKLLVEDLRPSALIFSEGFRVSRLTRYSKRVFDLALSLLLLVVAGPVMVLAAAAVWLESGFPVLYRQDRVGADGRVFTLHKFRSMSFDAEQGTPVWARAADVRVTRVGRAIRQIRVDELPQLWNVLRGDMSLVGPRPERPFFVSQLTSQSSFYEHRHTVKPGITGWAQVRYRYGASIEDALEKLRYDLYYVKHVSVLFDLTILFDTIKVVLFARGAR